MNIKSVAGRKPCNRNVVKSGSGSVPNSLLQGDPNTRVYLGIIDGEPDYVGIAYDVERRQSQHGDRFDYLREITTEPLTRRQARAIEQAMIKNHPTERRISVCLPLDKSFSLSFPPFFVVFSLKILT